MAVRKFTVTATTASDGTATEYSPYLSGKVVSCYYVKPGSASYTDGVDFTITSEATGESIWTEANVNASAIRYPRAATHSNAGVAALYAAGGTAVLDKIALGRDRIKVAIASGGDSKVGTFYFLIED